MPYDEKWKSLSRFFMGLGYWRGGSTGNAKYWLNEAIKHPETPAAKLAQTALKSLLADGEPYPINVWATVAGLPGAKSVKDFEAADEPDENPSQTSNDREKSQKSGAKPAGGLWKAAISNGYKGQTLSFRVSADGATISDVQFKGYLQCRNSRIEDTQLAPLKNIAVSGGSFADKQLYEGQIRIDFAGTFTNPNAASGTYRVMSSTDCDTYELKWTATRVGQ